VGPAPGILNHAIALSNLLHTQGNHEVFWITGEKSRDHLKMVGFNFPCEYSSLYDINFNRQDPSRKPHLQQVCDSAYLNDGIKYELNFLNKQSPDLIVTKHHYSPTISSRVACIPYATYYTDGGEYLFEDRNPQNRNDFIGLSDNYRRVAKDYGLILKSEVVTNYLKSPHLNIIRGIPKLSSLSLKEINKLEANSTFGGLLTYDGVNEEKFLLPANLPIVYVTFGTIFRNIDFLKMIIEALSSLPIYCVFSTMQIDPSHFGSFSNVLARKYIPNQSIMEKASLVIHHGGHGTTLSCFANGVPQIIIPDNIHSSAQAIHANTVVKLGCGVFLQASTLKKTNLQQEVTKILENLKFKKRSNQLRSIIFKQNREANNNLLNKISYIKNSLKNQEVA